MCGQGPPTFTLPQRQQIKNKVTIVRFDNEISPQANVKTVPTTAMAMGQHPYRFIPRRPSHPHRRARLDTRSVRTVDRPIPRNAHQTLTTGNRQQVNHQALSQSTLPRPTVSGR
jgi:hypothetical protein